ncbi:MAG: hypothetical protein ACREM2_09765, partial [Vulcanimicrobiaceae bacterium]
AAGALAVVLTGALAPALAQSELVRAGQQVDGKLTETLSSKTNHDGDHFTLTPHNGFFVKSPFPSGSVIEGHLEDVSAAGPTHKATMTIVIDDVKYPDGTTYPFHAQLKELKLEQPKTHMLRDTGVIVGSAVAGHFVSNKTGHKGGTLVGAAAGVALVSALKSDIVIKSGTLIRLRATEPFSATTTSS